MWLDNDVSSYGEGVKHLEHPITGPLALEYSTFAVSDHPDLGLVIFVPATPADRERVRALILGEAREETLLASSETLLALSW